MASRAEFLQAGFGLSYRHDIVFGVIQVAAVALTMDRAKVLVTKQEFPF